MKQSVASTPISDAQTATSTDQVKIQCKKGKTVVVLSKRIHLIQVLKIKIIKDNFLVNTVELFLNLHQAEIFKTI